MTESASWRLDGYRLDSLLGIGPHGVVWHAVQLSTQHRVAVKRLDGFDASFAGHLRRLAAVIGAVASPHLVPIRDVAVTTDGRLAVVSDDAAGGSLAALLERRTTLDAPEVVTLLAAVAAGLAALHSHGTVHGGVRATNVVFSADGRPMLTDAGLTDAGLTDAGLTDAGLTDAGLTDARQPAEDVAALAGLCRDHLATASAPAALLDLLDRAMKGAVTAEELASAAVVTGPANALFPSPLRSAADQNSGPPTACRGQPPSEVGSGRGWARGAVVAGVAAAGLAGAIAAGAAWARHDAPVTATAPPHVTDATAAPPPTATDSTASPSTAVDSTAADSTASSPPIATTAPAVTDWFSVISSLESSRDAALQGRQLTKLAGVDEWGSGAFARDRTLIDAMLRAGLRPSTLSSTVIAVRAVSVSGDTATVLVTDELSPYDLVDRSGRVVAHRPGRAAREFEMRLRHHPDGWRLVVVRGVVSR